MPTVQAYVDRYNRFDFGSQRPHVNKNEYRPLEASAPPSITQTQIDEFSSNIDDVWLKDTPTYASSHPYSQAGVTSHVMSVEEFREAAAAA